MSRINKFEIWISNWIDILCSLISVITFTCYRPGWDFHYRAYIVTRERNKYVEKENKKGFDIETDEL
jgi:hypothetical protein